MYWLFVVLASAVATAIAFDEPRDDLASRQKISASSKSKTANNDPATKRPTNGKIEKKSQPKKLFRGTVVLAQTALKKRGIQVADEMRDHAVLETPDGKLIPIAADWRGRAFYQDKRLRNRKVELVGYQREGVPYLQILTVYMFDEKGQREEMDYWCDICSIPMYEIKDCECCQGPILLRYRPAKLPSFLKLNPKATTPSSVGTASPKK
jgi:hypothetical protein